MLLFSGRTLRGCLGCLCFGNTPTISGSIIRVAIEAILCGLLQTEEREPIRALVGFVGTALQLARHPDAGFHLPAVLRILNSLSGVVP